MLFTHLLMVALAQEKGDTEGPYNLHDPDPLTGSGTFLSWLREWISVRRVLLRKATRRDVTKRLIHSSMRLAGGAGDGLTSNRAL